ncbi:malate:quinone oxidoreductase, partial [Staphylococcus warneri]|uniref:malate:quinone oxidoreductase n=1 Tax=Staphylococcus warneri TaxID=1292 RepID=UPI0037045D08
MFNNIQYTEDIQQITKSLPLIIHPHTSTHIIPPTNINQPTHLNFPHLTPKIPKNIQQHPNPNLQYNHQLIHFNHPKHGKSQLKLPQPNTPHLQTQLPHYLFIRPPPPPIPLLQKTPIPQTKHFPPFPITPQFLICTN